MRSEAKWGELFEKIEKAVQEWRAENPTATLTEIEKAVDKELSRVRVKMVEGLALAGASRDIKGLAAEKRPPCPQCGEAVGAGSGA